MPIDAKNYGWLDTLGALPRMVTEARALVGTRETVGDGNNPVIMGWAQDLSISYSADLTPWCGLFMAYVAKRAGKTPPAKPLWALNWAKFGVDGGQPELGDILTFFRTAPDGTRAGHVALYIGEDKECYHVLGGNQSDQVCFERKDKERVVAVRQPLYMKRPASVDVYLLDADGRRANGTEVAAAGRAKGGSEG